MNVSQTVPGVREPRVGDYFFWESINFTFGIVSSFDIVETAKHGFLPPAPASGRRLAGLCAASRGRKHDLRHHERERGPRVERQNDAEQGPHRPHNDRGEAVHRLRYGTTYTMRARDRPPARLLLRDKVQGRQWYRFQGQRLRLLSRTFTPSIAPVHVSRTQLPCN